MDITFVKPRTFLTNYKCNPIQKRDCKCNVLEQSKRNKRLKIDDKSCGKLLDISV